MKQLFFSKKILFVVTLLLFSVGSAFSQVDNSYKESLKKMLQANGSEESFKVAIKQMIGMFKQQRLNVPDAFWTEMEQEFLKTSIDDITDMLLPVYQNHLTESDIKEIIEFYQSPVGKKFADKTPLIMQESMKVGEQWGMKIGAKLQERLNEKGY